MITLKQPVVIGNANFYSSGYYYEGGVGMDDLDIWLNNWNAGRPPADAVIPEPSTAAVLGVIGIAGLCRRRR